MTGKMYSTKLVCLEYAGAVSTWMLLTGGPIRERDRKRLRATSPLRAGSREGCHDAQSVSSLKTLRKNNCIARMKHCSILAPSVLCSLAICGGDRKEVLHTFG